MKSIYMDGRWGELQQGKEKGEAVTFTFEKDGMRIIYPFIKRQAGIMNGVEYFDIVTPRGQCGPWIENVNENYIRNFVDKFNEEFILYCTKENIIAEYIRFSPWKDDSKYFSHIYYISPYGFLYCNDLTIDFFKDEYNKKIRRDVRVAEKNGVEVRIGNEPNSVDNFLTLYSFVETKYKVSDYYALDKAFLEQYIHTFPENLVFAEAVYKGQVICSDIILFGEDIAHAHFGASHPEYKSLQGNTLVTYKASLYAAERGMKLYDMGGAKKDSALERYKKGFIYRGKQYPYEIGTRILNHKIYADLVEQAGGPNVDYFPEYRKAENKTLTPIERVST